MKMINRIFKRNYFLVIYVKPDNFKFPIFIPVPLFVLEDLLDSVIGILRFAMRFTPESGRKVKWRGKQAFTFGDEYLDLALELITELRKVGPCTLVEVHDDEAHVSIKLY